MASITRLRTALQGAVSVGQGTDEHCRAVLEWGGVYGAISFVQNTAAAGTLASYLKDLRPLLNVGALTTAPLTLARIRRFDSGMTKIHSVFDSDWTPIYDSRVGAAIAMLFELYYADDRTAARIKGLAFPSGAARGSQIRNPGYFAHFAHAPQFFTREVPPHVWAKSQLQLAWVIEALLNRYTSLFATEGTFAARAHAFEATLFMLGYDLRCFTPAMRCIGLPIDATGARAAPARSPRGLTWVPTGISMPKAASLFRDYATTRHFTNLSSTDFVAWQTQERTPTITFKYARANASILRPLEFDLCERTEATIRCICGGGETGLRAAMAGRGAPVDERASVCLVSALLYGALKIRGLNRQQMITTLLENELAFSKGSAGTLLSVGSSVGKFFGLLDAEGAPTPFYATFCADRDYGDLLSELLPRCEAGDR